MLTFWPSFLASSSICVTLLYAATASTSVPTVALLAFTFTALLDCSRSRVTPGRDSSDGSFTYSHLKTRTHGLRFDSNCCATRAVQRSSKNAFVGGGIQLWSSSIGKMET